MEELASNPRATLLYFWQTMNRQVRTEGAVERVNLNEVASFQPAFAGTYRLQLRDATRTEVPVSRARVKDLRQRLGA